MPSSYYSKSSVKTLSESWAALYAWLMRVNATVEDFRDAGADRVKDAIIDFGWDPTDEEPREQEYVRRLPPICAEELIAGLRTEVESVLREATRVINQDAFECWTPETQDRLLALFGSLAQEALHQAAELRRAAATAELLPRPPQGEWARKYRRMVMG